MYCAFLQELNCSAEWKIKNNTEATGTSNDAADWAQTQSTVEFLKLFYFKLYSKKYKLMLVLHVFKSSVPHDVEQVHDEVS